MESLSGPLYCIPDVSHLGPVSLARCGAPAFLEILLVALPDRKIGRHFSSKRSGLVALPLTH